MGAMLSLAASTFVVIFLAELPDKAKLRLKALTPATYIGRAAELARRV